jgi:hypothetical protein
MATVVKRLDLTIGELVEVAGRRYEVVPDREGGATIEPPITPAVQLHAQGGTKPASAEDFERLSADIPYDERTSVCMALSVAESCARPLSDLLTLAASGKQ